MPVFLQPPAPPPNRNHHMWSALPGAAAAAAGTELNSLPDRGGLPAVPPQMLPFPLVASCPSEDEKLSVYDGEDLSLGRGPR